MNRQTKFLRKRGLSLKFNHGANLMQDAGDKLRAQHPEFTITELDSTKGITVNSNFSAKGKGNKNNKRNSAWRGCPKAADRD